MEPTLPRNLRGRCQSIQFNISIDGYRGIISDTGQREMKGGRVGGEEKGVKLGWKESREMGRFGREFTHNLPFEPKCIIITRESDY